VFVLQPDGTCVQQPAADFTLEVGHRYLVNPGSVGMPRTEDPRATYCIFDTQAGRLCFQRTSYGVREFRRLVEADAQDSEQLAYVLNLLDNHALPVLHERTNFAASPKPVSRPTVRRTLHVPRPQTTPAAPRAVAPRPAPPAPARRSRLPLIVGLSALALAGGLFGLFHLVAKQKRHATRRPTRRSRPDSTWSRRPRRRRIRPRACASCWTGPQTRCRSPCCPRRAAAKPT
jgi:hypothetical protein